MRRSGLTLLLLFLATGASAQTSPDSTLVLTDLSCRELAPVFYERIPRYVYDDQPDALYEMVLYATDRCDDDGTLGEPVGRTRILASIWDGNFDEAVYGFEVIGWLVDRYDPAHAPEPGSKREAFDTFTTDFADQLLPHTEPASLEEFFCLFYAGQPDTAWALLQGGGLEDTWLRYYYDEEVGLLERTEVPYTVMAHWGLWQPRGDQSFVGTKQLVGGAIEQRWSRWFARFVLEVRLGRSDGPYLVDQAGVIGFSDRWDALLVAVEGGLTVWRSGPHLLDVFAGLGYDGVRPFKDEDIAPAGVNLSLGAGYRLYLSRSRRWFAGLDGRYEWVSDRNEGGTALGGAAFSGRVGLGFSLGIDPTPRLKALGRKP